jgi:hypothetical protein
MGEKQWGEDREGRTAHTEVCVWMSISKENSFTAFTVSLLSRPTDLDSQEKAPPYGDGNHMSMCVCPMRFCKAIMVSVQESSKCKG